MVWKLFKLLIPCLLSLFIFSCNDCVTGRGELHEEERLMPEFSALSNDVAANIIIRPVGNRQSQGVLINAQQQIVPLISAKVVDGTLNISSVDCYNATESVEIIIYTNHLRAINFSGSGNVRSELTLSDPLVDIIHSGSGNIDFTVDCGQIRVELLGSGEIRSKGRAEAGSINLSGSGKVDFGGVVFNTIKAELNGSGNIECRVNENADFTLNGSGNILYSGEAVNIITNNNGSGEISHIQ